MQLPPTPDVSFRMSRTRGRDTTPELRVRSELHARGLRYFVDRRPIADFPRRADLVFPRLSIAVFIDGCFFHGCPQHFRSPKRNTEFWEHKIRQNIERDLDTNRTLSSAGWQVARYWEHEDPGDVVEAIERLVRRSRTELQ